ncbi:splicing regulator SDE2 [Bombina bombina]|uniref:splicing regulator SDE2 n=1 Tax=Bombina bombina TaxID=8345 RepID=UPI00235AFE91|nr:splicing regulator SDE2 [Bombina bombina]
MAVIVWVRDAVTGRVCLYERPLGAVVQELLLPAGLGIPFLDVYVKCNGRLVSSEEELQNGATYSLEPRLRGGKGGFGSMLRALGAQIEKTTNREACRDLSGRRLRDVNHEKAMAEWIKKQAEREAEKEQRRIERLQRKLAEPKHYFTDPEYHKQCHDMSERLEDSVIKGIQASSSSVVSPEMCDSRKRRKDLESGKAASGKKKCFWTGVEGIEPSSDSGSDSDESPCSSSMSGQSCKQSSPSLHSHDSQSDSDGSEKNQHLSKLEILDQQSAAANLQNGTSQEEPQISEEKATETTLEAEEPDSKSVSDAGQENSTSDDKLPENTEREKKNLETEHQQHTQNADSLPFDLLAFQSAAELETLGLEKLKLELMALGLKCGGTLQERAERLYSVRGLSRDQIDPSLFAKPAKGKRK